MAKPLEWMKSAKCIQSEERRERITLATWKSSERSIKSIRRGEYHANQGGDSHPHRRVQTRPAGKQDMLTSHRVGLQSLELCQILWACSEDLPENANLSSDSSEKFWLEIRDSAKGQISSKCRTREVEDQNWEKAKNVQNFCQSCFLSGPGQMVVWVRINTSGGSSFTVTRGLKGHGGLAVSCSSNFVGFGGGRHIAVKERL